MPQQREWIVGQRASWIDAPGWWNPYGEEIISISNGKAILAYGGRLIPVEELCSPKVV